jgi:TP901 family phage tail tape measure protein
MAGNKTISIGVKLDLDEKGFKNLAGSCEEFAKLMEASASRTSTLNKSLINFSAAAVSVATLKNALSDVSQVLNDITEESRGFSDAMRATNTMAGKGAEDLSALKRQVTDLAGSVPMARDALAQGLYQVISNGVPEENWITFLEKSARSAVGGIADLNSVVGVTSTVIKNYGLSWDAAGMIQDKIQLTAKNGVTSFEQLAATLPRVTGVAATLGASIDELMASFATLTGVSGNTAEVSTQLAAILNSLVKPSSEATKMAQQMGMEYDAAAVKAAGGFSAFLTALDQSVRDYAASTGMLSEEIYGKLFGSAEAMRAIIPLQGELREKFQDNIAAMSESAGTMDAAFNDMSKTGASAMQRLKNEFSSYGDMVSAIVAPVKPMMNMALTALTAAANVGILVTSMKALTAAAQGSTIMKLVTALGLYTTSAGRAAVSALGLRNAVLGAQAGANAASVAFRGLSAALGIIGAISLAVWGVTRAIQHMRGETEKAAQSESALSKVRETVSVRLSEQRLKIEQLIKTAEDERVSMDNRLQAVNELNKAIPGYNANIDRTTGAYKASKGALDAYLRSLEKQMMMEAAREQMQQLMSRKAQLLVQQAKYQQGYDRKQTRYAEAEAEYKASLNSGVYSGSAAAHPTPQQQDLMRMLTEASRLKNLLDDTTSELKKLDGEWNSLTSVLGGSFVPEITPSVQTPDVSTPTGAGKSEESTSTSKKEAPEGSLQALKDRMSDIDAKIRFSTDPAEIDALLAQKRQLQQSIDIRVNYITDKAEIDRSMAAPVTIPVKVDSESLETAVLQIPGTFRKANRESGSLSKNMQGVVECARAAASAFQGLGNALESPELNIAGIIAGAVANIMAGYAAAAATPKDPVSWMAFALSGLATALGVVSQIKNATAFAQGGIVSGPTYALVGEYAGARNNPEVIAPLNRLKELMPAGGVTPVVLDHEIVIDGSLLKILLRNINKRDSFVGRR